ncbi:MAG: protein phosphatase 2C domain-containing protein [Deltaproteobacteria bacterium]|jgi:serine/threonine protein phosphatase PrpC|nr:protein phosphatase 2C domain-containing protein [Deltaproteobacteria bacterium]
MEEKKDIIWVSNQILDMMNRFRPQMGGENNGCYVAAYEAWDILQEMATHKPLLVVPKSLEDFLNASWAYFQGMANLGVNPENPVLRGLNSAFIDTCKAHLHEFGGKTIASLHKANRDHTDPVESSGSILKFIADHLGRIHAWIESGSLKPVNESLTDSGGNELTEGVDKKGADLDDWTTSELSETAWDLPDANHRPETEKSLKNGEDWSETISSDSGGLNMVYSASKRVNQQEESPQTVSSAQRATPDQEAPPILAEQLAQETQSDRADSPAQQAQHPKADPPAPKAPPVPEDPPARVVLPSHADPTDSTDPELTKKVSLEELVSKSKEPTIAFRINGYAATPWLKKCLWKMHSQMKELDGSYDTDMTYSADIATVGAFRITEVTSNAYFATNGAQATPNAGTVPLAQPPVISLSGDGTAVSISGRWKPYDGDMSLIFLRDNDNEPFEIIKKEYYIRQDPRLMWKDLKVESDDGYPTADTEKKCAEIPDSNLIAVAASRRGRSHANTGKPRDDSFYMRCGGESGWSALAVADGAGSARYSRVGSRLACKTSVDAFLAHAEGWHSEDKEQKLVEILKRLREAATGKTSLSASEPRLSKLEETGGFSSFIYDAARKAYNSIAEEVERKKKDTAHPAPDASLNDYHTTLLFAAFRKFSFGWFLVTFWIGDGGLALYNPNGTGEVNVLGTPDAGEYAGQTRFLTMSGEMTPDKIRARTFYSFPQDFEALIMATDGVTDPFFPSEDSIKSPEPWRVLWTELLPKGINENPGCPELFDESVAGEVKSEKLLEWLNFWCQGEHDDRTLLIVKKK